MLTVAALYENVLDIPVVERHVRGAIHRAGFPLESYSGQQMLEVISALPREELFSAHRAAAARHRGRRARRRRAPRGARLPAPRPVPPVHLVPGLRARATGTRRRRASRWPTCCSAACGGASVDFTVRLTESALALVHFTVHTDPATPRRAPWTSTDLQDELAEAIRTWDDRLLSLPGSGEVADLLRGVPEAYKAGVDPAQALVDLRYVAGAERARATSACASTPRPGARSSVSPSTWPVRPRR